MVFYIFYETGFFLPVDVPLYDNDFERSLSLSITFKILLERIIKIEHKEGGYFIFKLK